MFGKSFRLIVNTSELTVVNTVTEYGAKELPDRTLPFVHTKSQIFSGDFPDRTHGHLHPRQS